MLYGELRRPQIESMDKPLPVVCPIASLEQHGRHLPLLTDTMITNELVARLDRELGDAAAFLPTLWIGSSHHHMIFPGTVSLRSDLYIEVLMDMLESLIAAGFRRILFLNGHGGNVTPAREAMYRVKLAHRGEETLWMACTTYWLMAAAELREVAKEIMESPCLTHACEYETSMILNIRHDLVAMEEATGTRARLNSAYVDPSHESPSRVDAAFLFEDITSEGAMGSPEKATSAKGERLLEVITPALAKFIREFATWSEIEK